MLANETKINELETKIITLEQGNQFLAEQIRSNERNFEIQKFIAQELKMRYCPKLTFFEDHTTEQVLKVEKILHEIKNDKKSDEN